MSIGGAEKEFIFNLYLKMRKNRMEQALGIQLGDDIQLERTLDYPVPSQENMRKKPVDIYATDAVLGVPVLMESFLGRSNGTHQKTVLYLINHLEEGTIIYQAFSFQDKHNEELRNTVLMSGKPIRLYLVSINQEVLVRLTQLDTFNKLDVYPNLGQLDKIPNVLRVVGVVEHPLFRRLHPRQVSYEPLDLSSRIGANKFLLQQLQKGTPQFFPFHREKSLRLDSPIICYGAGACDLTYHCSIRDSRGYAFVELRFGARDYLFRIFAMKPQLLEKCIDKRVYIRDNRIGVEFRASSNIGENVKKIAKIFRAMIENISRPIYDLLNLEYQAMAIRRKRKTA